MLKLVPSKEQCTSAVCRRILGIYGDVFKHANLNEATHQAIHEMFGIANMTTFNHLSLMVRKEQIVDKDGGDTYLPHMDRLAIPVTFVTGAENNLFLPEGTAKTLQTLSKANDAKLYQRILFPNYAHMDLYIGRDSARDSSRTIVARARSIRELAGAEPMPAHPGLADLLSYPLMSALAERRTRRIAQGVSLERRRSEPHQHQPAEAAQPARRGGAHRVDRA